MVPVEEGIEPASLPGRQSVSSPRENNFLTAKPGAHRVFRSRILSSELLLTASGKEKWECYFPMRSENNPQFLLRAKPIKLEVKFVADIHRQPWKGGGGVITIIFHIGWLIRQLVDQKCDTGCTRWVHFSHHPSLLLSLLWQTKGSLAWDTHTHMRNWRKSGLFNRLWELTQPKGCPSHSDQSVVKRWVASPN